MTKRITLTKKRVFFILIAVLLIIWFYHSRVQQARLPSAVAVAVTTSPVVQKDVLITTHAIGNIQPYITVAVKSRVDGQLLSLNFKEGDNVKAGQVIFKIDPHPYQVALEQAEANLARDKAQLENLQKLLMRYDPLVKKGYISKQDYDQADANVKAQVATLLSDKAAVDNAKLNLDYCTIRAPITGRTGKSLVNHGNLIKANDSNPLVIVNQIKPIYVVFSLPEQQLNDVKKESLQGPVSVAIQVKGQSTSLNAQLSFIDNTVDTTTGMIQLKALFPNNHEEIWPGQYVDVTLPLSEIKQALLVPTRAIQAGPEGSYLYIVKDDSRVTIQPITLGPVIGEETVINGLKPESIVVTTGQSQLIEGSLVRTTS